MDTNGNPIPGPSRKFNDDDMEKNIQISTSKNQDEIVLNPTSHFISFFEEIKSINFSLNQNITEDNEIALKLLIRCNSFIDIVGRNIVYLEEMISEIKSNINISKRNAAKAYKCIEFEKKSISKISTLCLKNKTHLANFFKFGLSNCPQNPHLTELYDNSKLILSSNGRLLSEECIESDALCSVLNKDFKNKLEKAIHTELLDKIKNPLIEQHSRLSIDQTLQNDPIIKNKIELEMFGVQKELDIISKTPFKQLVLQFMSSDSEYDWSCIAKLTNKPDLLCKRMWNIFFNPHISRKKWTKSEEEKLFEIVNHYKRRNWKQIAIEMGTNRSEYHCFIHFLKFIPKSNKKGKWSKQEDQKLLEIIKENSGHDIINWQKVYIAMHDDGRSYEQIYHRWMHSLKPGIKKGIFDRREKCVINEALKQNIPAAKVSSLVLTNRTSAQIRNAYHRISFYNKDSKRGPWDPEDDEILLQAVNSYTPNEIKWRQVSDNVPGRNPESCRHRFRNIEKKLQKNSNLTIHDPPRSKKFVKEPLTITEHDEPLNGYNLQKNFDLIIPQECVHKDLINEEHTSVTSYLKELSHVLTLQPNKVEETLSDLKFIHENPHDVLTTSDIINSDLSEVDGLLDIRMRNFKHQKSKSINTQYSKN